MAGLQTLVSEELRLLNYLRPILLVRSFLSSIFSFIAELKLLVQHKSKLVRSVLPNAEEAVWNSYFACKVTRDFSRPIDADTKLQWKKSYRGRPRDCLEQLIYLAHVFLDEHSRRHEELCHIFHATNT